MSELRQNPITGQWVVYALSRTGRPYDFRSPVTAEASLPESDTNCPFCPGNEHMLPPIIMETKNRNGRCWQTRVVPNRFPALQPEDSPALSRKGPYRITGGYGYHEVIIESPVHNRDIYSMPVSGVEAVVDTYHRRYVDLSKDERVKAIFIFRNHGKDAGTSLRHPHSQLIAAPVTPGSIKLREQRADDYYTANSSCMICDILRSEERLQERILKENASFLAFIPYTAEVPFEIYLFPKFHGPDFGLITDREKGDLSTMLQTVTRLLYRKLSDPDYNLYITSFTHCDKDSPFLHWYIVLQPRMTIKAGFEIGSGMAINPSLPEEDCKFLKDCAKEM